MKGNPEKGFETIKTVDSEVVSINMLILKGVASFYHVQLLIMSRYTF